MFLSVERVVEQRDVDAALYILEKMIAHPSIGSNRLMLEKMRRRIDETRSLTIEDRSTIVSLYREVIG